VTFFLDMTHANDVVQLFSNENVAFVLVGIGLGLYLTLIALRRIW